MHSKIQKTDQEWQTELSPESYYITRQKGTERAFTGSFWNHHDSGMYHCICCQTALFASDCKFDSGCGWPSYFSPTSEDVIRYETDHSHGMIRTEVLCNICDAHLGHVFEDGPTHLPNSTGLRYCINSGALNFIPLP